MSIDLPAQADGVNVCGRCGADASERTIVERVDGVLGVPFVRTRRIVAVCARCAWAISIPLPPAMRARVERPAGVLGRVLTTYALIATVIVGLVGYGAWRDHHDLQRVLAPQVSDRWTIDVPQWRDFVGPAHGAGYSVAEVTSVSATEIGLTVCPFWVRDESNARDTCRRFLGNPATVGTAKLRALLGYEVVTGVTRAGDSDAPYWLIVLGGLVALGLHGAFATRFLRRRRAELAALT